MLGRKIAKLFTHVKDVLSRAGASSPFGADYSSVLRSNLLTNAHYCSLVPSSTFQGEPRVRHPCKWSISTILGIFEWTSSANDDFTGGYLWDSHFCAHVQSCSAYT